jgi:hypothetical protein
MKYPSNTDHITVTRPNDLIDGVICSLSNWYCNYGVTISNDLHSAYIVIRDDAGSVPAQALNVTVFLTLKQSLIYPIRK